MNGDRTNFTVSAYPHSRPPDSDTGCYDAVHPVFLKISVRIFPEKIDREIAREYLSVMGMAA